MVKVKQVWLKREPMEKEIAFSRYWLRIDFEDEREMEIPLSDMSQSGGGMRLHEWKLANRDGKEVLGVYLEISVMGHELDQWAYFDLETGEKVK